MTYLSAHALWFGVLCGALAGCDSTPANDKSEDALMSDSGADDLSAPDDDNPDDDNPDDDGPGGGSLALSITGDGVWAPDEQFEIEFSRDYYINDSDGIDCYSRVPMSKAEGMMFRASNLALEDSDVPSETSVYFTFALVDSDQETKLSTLELTLQFPSPDGGVDTYSFEAGAASCAHTVASERLSGSIECTDLPNLAGGDETSVYQLRFDWACNVLAR